MPSIIKPSRIGTALTMEPVRGGCIGTVSAFVLFDFASTREFLSEQALWPMVAEQMPGGAIFDKGQLKPKGEFIVAGAALAPLDQPVTGMRVAVRLGAIEKRLAVFGDRYWRLTDRGVEMTQAQPFDRMPIDEVRSFGGPDHKSNPKGKGASARKIVDAGYDAPLPNVENADALIRSLDDKPVPASLGPIPPDSSSRMRFAGTYDQHWMNKVAPFKPDDFNPLFYCDAPEDQRLEGYFDGDEAFSVSGMTRRVAIAEGRLPNVRIRCFAHRPSEDSFTEIHMVNDTVTLFPNVTKATLAFRGLIKSKEPFCEDIGAIMLALEHVETAPRPAEYYLRIFGLRTDPETAHRHALSDFELMPDRDKVAADAHRQAKLETARQQRETFLDNQNWAARKALSDQGISPDLVPPVDYSVMDEFPLVAQPTEEELSRGDVDLAELLDDVEALNAAMHQRKDLEMAKAELYRQSVAKSTPSSLLPEIALKPIVDAEHMARFPNLTLDEEIASAFDALEATTPTGAPSLAGSTADHPAGFDNLDDEIDAIFAQLSQTKQDDPALVEKSYATACARAMMAPEGSMLYEARNALSELDTIPLGSNLASADDDAADAKFKSLFSNLGDTKLKQPGADPAPIKLMPTSEIDADTEGANAALNSAGDKLRSQFPHLVSQDPEVDAISDLQSRLMALLPAAPDTGDMTIAEVVAEKKVDIQQQFDEADVSVAESMIVARRQSPIAIFPMEPLAAGIADRLGQFIADKLDTGHSFKGADLAGANLAGINFSGLDLASTCFEHADLTGANFSGCNLVGAVFTEATLDKVNFSRTQLGDSNLSKASARDAIFDASAISGCTILETDFTGASFGQARFHKSTMIDCVFDGADMSGADLADLQWIKGSAQGVIADGATLARISIIQVPMAKASFIDCQMERIALIEIPAKGATFSGANFNSVSFLGKCDLQGSHFMSLKALDSSWNTTDLSESCFLRADCEACLFNDCDMASADLRLASLRHCRFEKSRLGQCDLFGANLFSASLGAVDLRLASLRNANLYQANLTDAKIGSADFTGANLGRTILEQPSHA